MNAESYDAIVIGSGAGGAACAYRLVKGGLKVLMLEKGGYLPSDGSTLDTKRVVAKGEFLSHERWVDGHGRSVIPQEHFNVGGKTKWYGAALLPLAAREFETDGPYGCTGWPLGLADFAPYYAEAEKLLGVHNFVCEPDLARILKRAARRSSDWRSEPMPMGLASDITSDPLEATHFDGFASARGLKNDAEHCFLAPLAGAENFQLQTHAEVTTLLSSARTPFTLTGVRLADGREFRAPLIFLAAGALHSPRLLTRFSFAARIGTSMPPPELAGRHLKLHLLTVMVSVGTRRVEDVIRKTVILTNELYPHSSVQPLGFDGELISTLIPKVMPRFLAREVASRSYGFFLQTEDASDPRNRVLDARDGRAGLPVLDYDEKRMPHALREHRGLTRAFKRALRKAGLLSFTQRIGLAGTAHACGTLRCGHNVSDSMVDSEGRVRGAHGLYVVDGSILPRIGRMNPALTIYAWGLRVGELVAKQFGREQSDSAQR